MKSLQDCFGDVLANRFITILCICSWLCLQPLGSTPKNPNVCHEIKEKIAHSKTNVQYPCLFCSFHHHVLLFPELPQLWEATWLCCWVYFFLSVIQSFFICCVRYSRPLSHAPPFLCSFIVI